jgi:hypothetical protein
VAEELAGWAIGTNGGIPYNKGGRILNPCRTLMMIKVGSGVTWINCVYFNWCITKFVRQGNGVSI